MVHIRRSVRMPAVRHFAVTWSIPDDFGVLENPGGFDLLVVLSGSQARDIRRAIGWHDRAVRAVSGGVGRRPAAVSVDLPR